MQLFQIIISKFKLSTGLNKIIGSSKSITIRERNYTKYKYKKLENVKGLIYYISKFKKYKYLLTYTFLKLNKDLFFNCDFFKTTNLNFLKKNISFRKKQRMLRTFLKKTLTLKKSISSLNYANPIKIANFNYKKLNKYRNYNLKSFSFFKNLNIKSIFLKNRRINRLVTIKKNKLRNRNSIFFKKKFLKSLIFSRNMFKFLFNIKLNKKKKISRLVASSSHLTFFNRLIKLEFTLFNLLLRCRILFTIKDAYNFIKNGYVYVNNSLTCDPFKQLSVHDRIQIVIGKSYFFFRSFFYSKIKIDIAKLKNKMWRKRSGNFNLFRKRSKLWPNWIFRTAYYNTFTPSYLEVDILSLTIILLFVPSRIVEYKSIIWKYVNLYNYRLYGWKVIN